MKIHKRLIIKPINKRFALKKGIYTEGSYSKIFLN
jgi:hypothetical protein